MRGVRQDTYAFSGTNPWRIHHALGATKVDTGLRLALISIGARPSRKTRCPWQEAPRL